MSLPELKFKARENTKRLGELAETFLERSVKPGQKHLSPVFDAWQAIVPPGFAPYCRIHGVVRSELRIGVDSPVYLYELQLCSQDLLKALQAKVPEAGLRRIKFMLG
ncbi:MAG: DUF721 domain-containing protein [Phycisphaerae bacterium]|nr:DUF721 domain-containing protein [Phycisphaerae bacterium]